MASRFRIALIQMFVARTKEPNLKKAKLMIKEAAKQGAKIVSLPEYFTSLLDPKFFIENKEPTIGPTFNMLSQAAKDNQIYLFGGTYPEETFDGKLYNTTAVFNPVGELMGLFRKMHLFDVDLGPRMRIMESDLNVPGNSFTVVDTEYCKVGVGICLDLRFPEFARIYTDKGCKLLVYIGAFSTTTGPKHWEILQRVRAVDNQVYVATIGPATDETAPYVTYGHSSVVDPWGEVIATTGSKEDIVYADIDLNYIDECKRKMPISKLKRDDLYEVHDLSEGTEV